MAIQKRIALVEDEAVIRKNYTDALTAQGFEVEAFANRAEAMTQLSKRLPDLAVLDVELAEEPEGGFLLCQELRAMAPSLPIIFLTGHDDEVDRISGYRLGADDYLTKDKSLRFLTVRIHTLLQRVEVLQGVNDTHEGQGLFQLGKLTIDRDQCKAYWSDQPVDLTLTQFWMVMELAESAGKVKSLTELMQAAKTQVHPNTITANVARIRKLFCHIDADFNAIENVHGRGYRWRVDTNG